MSIMRWVHQINVMGSIKNQLFKNFTQSALRYTLSEIFPADAVILAEYAPQTAAGEEYSTRSVRTGQRRFLPEMQCCPGYNRLIRHAAFSGSRKAVYPAFPRAQGAGGS